MFDLSNVSLSTLLEIGGILIGLGMIYGRIVSLEKKVDKHNNVIERVYHIESNIGETDIGALKQHVQDMDARIDKVEQKGCNNTCLNASRTS